MIKRMEGCSDRNRKVFLDGLKKYQQMGVPVYVDDREADERLLERIFERNEKEFYMGDYILEDSLACRSAVCEPSDAYDTAPAVHRFRLKEIRFDKVHHQ